MNPSIRMLRGALGPRGQWQGKLHRVLFWVCAACLALYLSFVLFLAESPIFSTLLDTLYALLWWVAYGGVMAALLWRFATGFAGLGWCRAERERLRPGFFFLSLGLGFGVLGVGWLANYPGAVSYDVFNQWTQAQTLQLNSWHPVFHTLLMWLGIQILGSYPWMVLAQVLCFCAAFAYLLTTLRAWGAPGWLLLGVEGLTVASALVGNSMMYLWKDNAMTIGIVLLCSGCVNLYATKGAWLSRPRNALLLGLVLAFTTLVRHNAILFTLPLALCLALCCRSQWRKGLLMVGAWLGALALVMGPLYGALDIVAPNNTLEEAVGLPMTVMLDIRAKNPDALDPDTAAYLEALVPDGLFQEKYVPGQYNSVKFTFPRERVSTLPAERLLGMAWRAFQADPRNGFLALSSATDLVWDVTGKNEGHEAAKNSGDMQEYPAMDTRWNRLGRALQGLVRVPMELYPVRWLCQNIGVQMALLLLCGLWGLYRRGPLALCLCLPTVVYNLGTMLLLAGNDARFFQYTMVVSLPAALLLLAAPPGEGAAPAQAPFAKADGEGPTP